MRALSPGIAACTRGTTSKWMVPMYFLTLFNSRSPPAVSTALSLKEHKQTQSECQRNLNSFNWHKLEVNAATHCFCASTRRYLNADNILMTSCTSNVSCSDGPSSSSSSASVARTTVCCCCCCAVARTSSIVSRASRIAFTIGTCSTRERIKNLDHVTLLMRGTGIVSPAHTRGCETIAAATRAGRRSVAARPETSSVHSLHTFTLMLADFAGMPASAQQQQQYNSSCKLEPQPATTTRHIEKQRKLHNHTDTV